MAEEEVNYASVVFKANNNPAPEAKKDEETVYDEVKTQSETTAQTADTQVSAGFVSDKKAHSRRRCYQLLACWFGILCVILLMGIIAVCVYVATLSHEQSQLKENQTALLAENGKLTTENENFKRDNYNLTQNNTVLEKKITNLTAEKQELETQNQQLEAEKNNLMEQIHNMETKLNELNISRAQWSIDAYCLPKDGNSVSEGQCKPCQKGWDPFESSCYAVNNPEEPEWKTWDGARENCRGKISDLVVIGSPLEKEYVYNNSWDNLGYWIGLRKAAGTWTWVDGSIATQYYWTETPSDEDNCVISKQGTPSKGWEAVKCDERHRWICEKKALSV